MVVAPVAEEVVAPAVAAAVAPVAAAVAPVAEAVVLVAEEVAPVAPVAAGYLVAAEVGNHHQSHH